MSYSPVLENLDLVLAEISHSGHMQVKEYLVSLEEEQFGGKISGENKNKRKKKKT